jgi:actin-related protein 8
LTRRKDWAQYSCVYIIPDLYERQYVTSALEMLLHQFGFGRVCFIQESLAATFGSGYSTSCIVDIGAQKTSICCVEEGMCIENSRINLKYGGADITETFIKMMLFDHFPYEEINLRRRYDFLLAEELKQKFCTMNEADISVQLYDFHLRASGQDTRKYAFKTYDEVMLAPLGFFQPTIFETSHKLRNRRKLIDRSYDLYDGAPNDPISTAQLAIYDAITASGPGEDPSVANGGTAQMTTRHQQQNHNQQQPFNPLHRITADENTPRSSVANSPGPEAGNNTPQPPIPGSTPPPNTTANGTNPIPPPNPHKAKHILAAHNDTLLPIYPLELAILTSISNAAPELEIASERKTRDFLSGIMLIGGGSLTPGLHGVLEDRLRA